MRTPSRSIEEMGLEKSDQGQTLARSALMLALSLGIALCGLEALVRITGLKPAPPPYDNNRPDGIEGMKPEPSRRWKANFPEYDGPLYMQTNNLGFYEEKDTPIAKAAGQTRVAVVGDSQTVGSCMARESYPNVLEDLLNQRAGAQKFEVLNAGVGRCSPYQYYVRAKDTVIGLKPDHILVALYVGNDFLDLVRQDDRPYLTRDRSGVFTAHPPRFLVYDDPARTPSLLERSRVYQFGKAALGPTILYQISRFKLLTVNLANTNHGWSDLVRYALYVKKLDSVARGVMLQSLHQYVWFSRFPETLPDSLAINREVMKRFHELCRRQGIRLTYVIVPTKLSIEPEDLQQTFTALAAVDPSLRESRVAGFEDSLIEKTLADAASLGVDTIDLRSALRSRRAGRRLYYPQDLHLNVTGNRVVAEALADRWTPTSEAGNALTPEARTESDHMK